MVQVWKSRDLEIAYEILQIYEEYIKKYGRTANIEKRITEQKREVRGFHKIKSDRRIVKDNGIDGFVELVELPEYLKSTEDATEYFEEYEVRHAIPSMYDCTGQAFTSWFKVFKRHNKFFAYQSICFDV